MSKIYKLPPVEIKLSDLSRDHAPQWIQVLRPGTFYKGDVRVEITKEHIISMAANHKENVRGIDIALDYAHMNDKEAAAWFKELAIEGDGSLWGFVEWTNLGEKKVNSKEYRYISADINFDYENNETKEKHGPTLLGAGLTNRPVVKHMQPIILSEDSNGKKDINKGDKMNLEEEVKKLKEENKSLKEKLAGMKKGDDEKKFEEKLSTLSEENKALKTEIAEAKEKEVLTAKKVEFDTMLSEGKVVEAQRKSFIAGDMGEFVKNACAVNLNEKGSNKEEKKEEKFEGDVQDKVIELAEKLMNEEEGMEFSAALDQVLSENHKLNEEYIKVFS